MAAHPVPRGSTARLGWIHRFYCDERSPTARRQLFRGHPAEADDEQHRYRDTSGLAFGDALLVFPRIGGFNSRNFNFQGYQKSVY